MRTVAARGWFPMITPGTKLVTIGGCIANDVHGKAHHARSRFITCLDAVSVRLANDEVVTASRGDNSELFFATSPRKFVWRDGQQFLRWTSGCFLVTIRRRHLY